MKNKLIVFASAFLALMLTFSISASNFGSLIAHATTNGTYMINGIDYSGQGTVINGTTTGDAAYTEGNYVNIPIYKGAYKPNSGWNWYWNSNWSSWSPYNNKSNDYNTYRGATTKEYNVESRVEYRYKRTETKDTYATKYHTTYQGSRWWNCGIVLFTSQWGGYEGNRSNFKIIDQWTTSEKYGTTNVTVYSDWRTSAPLRLAGENQWSAYTSRTVYRYKTLDMHWDEKAQTTTEKVPLNYSLYDKNGKPIKAGLVWNYGYNEKKIAQENNRTFIQKVGDSMLHNEKNLDIQQYYITSTEIMKMVRQDIEANQTKIFDDNFFTFIKSELSSWLTEAGIMYLAKKAGNKGLGIFTSGLMEYINWSAFTSDQKAFIEYIAKLNDAIEKNNENSVLILSFVHNTSGNIIPSRKLRLTTSSNRYVPLNYDYDFCSKNNLEYFIPNGIKAFGSVSYLDENEMKQQIISNLTYGYNWETIIF